MAGMIKFSSKRFFLTLMLCACSVILLQNYDLSNKASFTINLLCVFGGLFITFLCFIPSMVLKQRTDADFLMLARQKTPSAVPYLIAVYALYFIYAAEFFLIPYTDMFQKKYYSEVSRCVIALLLLAACVYAAFKGANVITRFGIFLFVFAMLTNALMFGGSLSSLDFAHGGFELAQISAVPQNMSYFVIPAFTAAIFACLSGCARGFRLHQPITALALTGVKFSLVIFFIRFALGDYAQMQEYQTFVLSRVAHFASYSGVESFYLALATMSVFMIISLIFCCVCRSANKNGSLKLIIPLAAAVFAVNLLARYNSVVEAALTSTPVFLCLTVITAVIIPSIYLFIRRKSNAEKNLHIITES